jgi:hypothetical protein
MRVLGTLTRPETIRRILLYLGLRAEPLARAPARDPPMQQLDFVGSDSFTVFDTWDLQVMTLCDPSPSPISTPSF